MGSITFEVWTDVAYRTPLTPSYKDKLCSNLISIIDQNKISVICKRYILFSCSDAFLEMNSDLFAICLFSCQISSLLCLLVCLCYHENWPDPGYLASQATLTRAHQGPVETSCLFLSTHEKRALGPGSVKLKAREQPH